MAEESDATAIRGRDLRRLSPILPQQFTPAQRRIFESVTRGKRTAVHGTSGLLNESGAMRGPFNAWLNRPALGDLAQRLGEELRFEGMLHETLREIAVLVAAAHWRSQFEWWSHEKLARKAGVPDGIIDEIREGRERITGSQAETSVHVCVGSVPSAALEDSPGSMNAAISA